MSFLMIGKKPDESVEINSHLYTVQELKTRAKQLKLRHNIPASASISQQMPPQSPEQIVLFHRMLSPQHLGSGCLIPHF